MIDLSKISAFKKTAVTPGIYAAVVAKGEGFSLDAAKAAMTKAGFKVDAIEETDDAVFFKQDDKAPASIQTMKINDTFGLVIGNIQKSFESYDFQSTTFKDLFATEGFFPSMWMGTDMLAYTIGNIMQKAENPGEAATMIGSALDEFKGWLNDLATAIPEHAFKADIALHKAELDPADPTAPKDPATDPVTDTPAVEEPEADADAEDEAEEGDDTADADAAAAELAKAEKPKKKVIVTTKKADTNDELLAALGTLLDTKLTDVTKSVDASVAKLTKRLDGVDTKLAKAEEAIHGTVEADADGDHDEPVRTTKSEKGPPPLLDTGMGRNA